VTTSISRAAAPRVRRFVTTVPALLLTALVLTTAAVPAAATGRSAAAKPTTPQTTAVKPATSRIAVDAVPAWVAPGADFSLKLRLTVATTPLVLRLSIHPAITSRTAFSDTLAGRGDPDVIADLSYVTSFLRRTKAGDTVLPVGLQDPDKPRDERRLRVSHSGVYPVTLSLSPPDADPVATTTTWLVVAEQPLETRLAFAWLWQIQGPPLTADNSAAVKAAVEPTGRLGRAAQALTLADTIPLSLVIGPETVASWSDIARHDSGAAEGLDALRASIAAEDRRQVLATPYVPLDIPSLESAGLADHFVPDLRLGTDTVQSVLGVVPDPRTVMLDRVDGGALALTHDDAFAQRFVVPESAVVPVPHTLTPARWFAVRSDGRDYTATSSSAFAQQLLNGGGSHAERAQRFLAGLSLIALEAPSKPRGIVLATPAMWDPDLSLISRVLSGLRSNPYIRPTTLDNYFSFVPADTDDNDARIVTTLTKSTPRRPTVTASQLSDARHALASFRSLVGPNDPRVAEGEHAILIAPSSALDPETAASALQTIDRDAHTFLSSIKTTGRTITLTSRTARIPISFSNETGQTVRVRVRLESTKLTFPDGAQHVLKLPPRNTTIRFPVTARASGTFTLQVTLTTADGQFEISTTQITVRSTVFSSIGVILTVGALLFLAFWWGNHIWRSRRARRAAAATPSEPVLPEPAL